MRIKSTLLSAVFVSAALPFVAATPASAMCTVATAKQSVSANTLCACDVVSSRMLKYIQRRADFESILERTQIECPGFAAVLTDLPTASIGFSEQRSGDGASDESTERDDPDPETPDNDPDPERDPDPKGDPDPEGDPDPKGDPDPEGDPDPKGDPDPEEPTKPDQTPDDGTKGGQGSTDTSRSVREKLERAEVYNSKADWHAEKAEIRVAEGNLEDAEYQRQQSERYRDEANALLEEARNLQNEGNDHYDSNEGKSTQESERGDWGTAEDIGR